MHEAILHYSPWFENVQRAAVENSSHGCFALLARIFSSCHFAPEGQIVSTTSFALFSMSRCGICNNALRTPANTQDLHVVFAETHSVRYLPGLFCPRSESWLNPAAANSASTLSRGQGWIPGHSSDLVSQGPSPRLAERPADLRSSFWPPPS